MEAVRSIEAEKNMSNRVALLAAQLCNYGIDTSRWGKGATKPLESLAMEILEGESRLKIIDSGNTKEVRRYISIVAVNVFYGSPDNPNYRLIEEVQEFADGSIRERVNLPESVSEKMKEKEEPIAAVLRGLHEELGLAVDKSQIELIDMFKKTEPSRSYPGITNVLRGYRFDVFLSDSQFDPDGYIEEQTDKNTYFSWQPTTRTH